VNAEGSSVETRSATRAIDRAVVGLLAISIFGVFARQVIVMWGHGERTRNNIFNVLLVQNEGPFLLLLTVAALATGMVVSAMTRSAPNREVNPGVTPVPTRRAIGLLSLAVAVIALATYRFVLHGYLFSMDEYSADFQSRIFASGQLTAALRPPWRSIGIGLTPTFVFLDFESGRWMTQYLPGYSLLKAPFVSMHAGPLLNPLLAGLSVVCIVAVARRLWPGDGLRPWAAGLLLATSSQFLVTSGTGYSMPAHLCLNLLWLWLYLRGDRRSWMLALLVGLLALELHSPFPHALFVAPFLVRLLRERRWGRLGSAIIVYGIGSVLGFAYLRYVHPAMSAGGGMVSLFEWPGSGALVTHAINLAVLLSWQAPLVGVFALAALARPRRLDPALTDLALGLGATLAFFVFFPLPQGHGWGYRYAYQTLGNLALLAAAGMTPIREAVGERRARLLLATAVAVATLVELPVRLWETERVVRPYAAADAYVRSRGARVVVIRGDSLWYGTDLVRNDPLLRQWPAVLRAEYLAPGTVDEIRRVLPNGVVEISDEELARLGVPRPASYRPRVH
jgi:hypothetical protein